MKAIQIFTEDSIEHKKLELAASMMTFLSPNKKRYSVGECWFDYGAKMAWTTIFGASGMEPFSTYQALYPKRQQKILEADGVEGILSEVKAFLADANGGDK